LRLRLLAARSYATGRTVSCVNYGYIGLLVALTSLNHATGMSAAGPWTYQPIQASPPCTTTGCNTEGVYCTSSPVNVPDEVRSNFFDYVFPAFTTDPSAYQLCTATGLVTPDASLQCTLFMKTAPTNSGRLFYEGDHCGAEVFFGCPITGCLPLPVSDEAPCTL